MVQIRAAPHFQIILLLVIMFTRFICQNDFHPLSTNLRGHCGLVVKSAMSSKREIPGSNPGSASFSYHTSVYNYVHHVSFSK